jgi:hypothetical protein
VDRYRFTVAAGDSRHLQPYSNEELKFLTGNGAAEITQFRRDIGLWDNFSVSRGMDGSAWTTKSREALLATTSALLLRVEAERDLFSFNYKLRCPSSLSRSSSKCWAVLEDGSSGALLARHAGQLYLECQGPVPKIIDMRRFSQFENEQGLGRIYKKANELRWASFLAALESFLQSSTSATVQIRHDHAGDVA